MNIFGNIFKRKSRRLVSGTRLVNESTATFTAYQGNAYGSDIYREGVDAIARNTAKLKGSHVIRYKDGRTDGDGVLNRLLQIRPNPYMSAYDFLYKVVTRLYLYNNSFVYIDKDKRGEPRAFYPINAASCQFYEDPAGSLFVAFFLKDGKEFIFPYSQIIHLRRFYSDDDLLGDDNTPIRAALELAQTQNEGTISAIKAGAHIRGILKVQKLLTADKLKETRDQFIADYLSIDNDGGVVTLGTDQDYQPIENRPVVLDSNQTKEIRTKIYNYLGVTEAIVNSSYSEDEFSAFYESTIEPLAVALSQEFTAKIFTDKEQAYGNGIFFESSRIQFMNNNSKITAVKELYNSGILTTNQALDILNLPAVEDGDTRIQPLNMINADLASAYALSQIGKIDNKLLQNPNSKTDKSGNEGNTNEGNKNE